VIKYYNKLLPIYIGVNQKKMDNTGLPNKNKKRLSFDVPEQLP